MKLIFTKWKIKKVEEAFEKLPWIKAIIVNIDVPRCEI